LTREIARRFNNLYGDEYDDKSALLEPEGLFTKTPRLLGLDGRKMSKSFDNYIALSDPPEVIRKKVSGMFTDPKRIKLTDKGHPEKCNVHTYYNIFAEKVNVPKSEIVKVAYDCRQAKIGCTECKKNLAEILIEYLQGIHTRREELKKMNVREITIQGAKKAKKVASETLTKVKTTMDIPPPVRLEDIL